MNCVTKFTIEFLNQNFHFPDELPYITLSYANGPGYETIYDENGQRKDLTETIFGERSASIIYQKAQYTNE